VRDREYANSRLGYTKKKKKKKKEEKTRIK
jgi:hypothetical protein